MRRLMGFLLVLLMCTVIVVPARAQSNVTFDQLNIEVWPEYDRSDVLVIYRITLSSDVSLPAQINLRIPRAVQSPYSLAWQDVDGSLYNLAYSTQIHGEWLMITFTTQAADVQLEYYDPGMVIDGTTRNFDYQWNGDYTVNSLNISVQQPRTVETMTLSPGLGNGTVQSDGLIYYSKSLGKVESGVPFKIHLNYEKNDSELSVGLQPVQSADSTQPAMPDITGVLPMILIAAAVILLITVGMWYALTRRPVSVRGQNRRRHSGEKHAETNLNITQDSSVYCHSCGRKAGPNDVYCRTCGTKLKKD